MADAITLQVEGMSCGHCIRAVTNAITALDQAAKVEVDLAAKRVVAQTSLPRAEVVRAVEEEGFAVKGWNSAISVSCRSTNATDERAVHYTAASIRQNQLP
ncbi:MAG: heavy-metal-associated domain-containing protein [Roseomonas sp.]|nr:heavy-metal-associated domain-containing protein [Roseomonas sp.]